MSNFTDFNIFETQKDVSLRYVDFGESFGDPDIVIIPGTKSTIDDLMFLRKNGLENQIKEYLCIDIFENHINLGYHRLEDCKERELKYLKILLVIVNKSYEYTI